MKWEFMVSLRYLLEKRKERFISVTTFISVVGIAVGVAALIITMGIVNGFDNEIEEKILSINPHIIITAGVPISDSKNLMNTIEGIDGVLESAEFLDGQAVINVEENTMGILLRGVHPDPRRRLPRMDDYIIAGTSGLKGSAVIVGSELANNYRLKVGQTVSIISPLSGQAKEFKVNGIFKSGRYDYDFNLVFMNIKEVGRLLQKEGMAGGIGLRVADAFNVDNVKHKIQSIIRPPYRTTTWKEIEKNLFSALRLEKLVLFIVVALIIFVACFNIISTLIMTVMEKTKDIGILKAIGSSRLGIMSVFLLEGLYVSIIGILLGSGIGLGLCHLQSRYEFIKLPPDVYYIYSVPVQVRIPDTIIIILAAFVLGLVATIYPSMHAATLNPVDALKYE